MDKRSGRVLRNELDPKANKTQVDIDLSFDMEPIKDNSMSNGLSTLANKKQLDVEISFICSKTKTNERQIGNDFSLDIE